MKKRIIVITLILIIFLMMGIQKFCNKSFADQSITGFKLNSVDTKLDDEISIALEIENDKAFVALDFVVEYDTTKLDYISYENGSIENFTIYANESSEGIIKIAGIQSSAQSQNVSANTSIVKLKFKVIYGENIESIVKLHCTSLYTSEDDKAETTTTDAIVRIIKVSGVSGNIQLEDGEYSDSSVYLYKKDTDTIVDESTIDENGKYELAAKEPGEYYIKIKKTGYLDFYINNIKITDINNVIKPLNNVELVGGDLNNDGEVEIMDLIQANDDLMNSSKSNISKEVVINNYNKKAVQVDATDMGY